MITIRNNKTTKLWCDPTVSSAIPKVSTFQKSLRQWQAGPASQPDQNYTHTAHEKTMYTTDKNKVRNKRKKVVAKLTYTNN